MKLQTNPFELIRNSKKNIEVRLYDEKRRNLKIGDIIEFNQFDNPDKKIQAKIIGLLNYQSFADLFNDFPAENFGGSDNEELLKNIYEYYTKEQERKYTVLGIKITLLN